jgi:hypothetical protein
LYNVKKDYALPNSPWPCIQQNPFGIECRKRVTEIVTELGSTLLAKVEGKGIEEQQDRTKKILEKIIGNVEKVGTPEGPNIRRKLVAEINEFLSLYMKTEDRTVSQNEIQLILGPGGPVSELYNEMGELRGATYADREDFVEEKLRVWEHPSTETRLAKRFVVRWLKKYGNAFIKSVEMPPNQYPEQLI